MAMAMAVPVSLTISCLGSAFRLAWLSQCLPSQATLHSATRLSAPKKVASHPIPHSFLKTFVGSRCLRTKSRVCRVTWDILANVLGLCTPLPSWELYVTVTLSPSFHGQPGLSSVQHSVLYIQQGSPQTPSCGKLVQRPGQMSHSLEIFLGLFQVESVLYSKLREDICLMYRGLSFSRSYLPLDHERFEDKLLHLY